MATAATRVERFEDRNSIEVLVVSPNLRLQTELEEKLSAPRWHVQKAKSGAEALKLVREHGAADGMLLLDPLLPDLEAREFHAIVQDRFPSIQVLMLNSHTGQVLISSASPTSISRNIADAVNRTMPFFAATHSTEADEEMPIRPDSKVRLRSVIGDSAPMLQACTMTRMVAVRDTTVLITGESGTGKDLIAQEIHLISNRRNHPLVVVNCSAIPETLLEAELFGYTKGSFTGAVQSRIGRIHSAHGGTLFLDEIGDMPLSLQSKILRFLEQGEVQRIGGNDNLKVNVRVIAATNANLKKLVSQQLFREDLYYRLAVFPIHLPPLRDRLSDVEELAVAFATRYQPEVSLTREAIQVLEQHSWPGNVRELRNAIERAIILAGSDREIKPEHIIL